MQTLTAPPRDTLTAAQVTALLTGPNLAVSAGAERLNDALAVVEDISDDLLGGGVERVMGAIVHGTCKLDISRALAWGADLIRPYMTLSDGTVTARFNLGVFTLTTPARPVGISPETYSCTGYDRLYLLHRAAGDSYQVVAGTGHLAAVTAAITAAGLSGVYLDSTAAAKTLPTDITWPLLDDQGNPTTWLQIVNDLLAAVGYRGLWADENGLFRSEPYVAPAGRPAEFTFDADSGLTILGEDRTFTQDTWNVPNRWVFVQNNYAGTPSGTDGSAGIYAQTNTSDGPTSTTARGLTWTKVVKVDAADQASLVARGDLTIAADKRIAAALAVTTGPFPVAGHVDVFSYADSALGAPRKVQATRWQLDLSGADMTWDWEVV